MSNLKFFIYHQVWDPMKSATISQLDLGKSHSIVSIRTLPAPSTTVALASSEGTLRYERCIKLLQVCELLGNLAVFRIQVSSSI